MDIEERLEKAEQSDSPSLVGSSIRSADDSTHKNYIHPEKYKSSKDINKLKRYSKLNSAITASLDDLINEGALLGSEADFDKFLDQDGSVKTDAQYTPEKKVALEETDDVTSTKGDEVEVLKTQKEDKKAQVAESSPQKSSSDEKSSETESSVIESEPEISSTEDTATDNVVGKTAASSFYKQEDYSTPNLSEFQLEHDIKDHKELIDHVQSYDLQKLPNSNSSFNSKFRKDDEVVSATSSQPTLLSPAQQQRLEGGLHTPFFHTERPRSRSRSANPTSTTRDRSSSRNSTGSRKPHLARGDSYKSTHEEEPSKYELPADLAQEVDEAKEEEEPDERRSRQSKPTMGESIAAAEAKAEALGKAADPAFEADTPLTRDPSLVTTGDYTNFEVDTPKKEIPLSDNFYTARSASATNYLRSISRSRSAARNASSVVGKDEKNDSSTDALVREGALISDDPYSTIEQLDTMVEEVLHIGDNTLTLDTKSTDTKDSEKEKFVAEPKSVDKTKELETKTSEKSEESKESGVEKLKEFDTEKEISVEESKKVDDNDETDLKESKETKVEKASDKPITHEELIDEDIEKAKHQSNEKDDANTDVLAEEGALVNEDDYDLVDKKELEKEGITTEEEAPLNIKEKKSEKTVQEDVLESSVKKDDEKPILDVESKEAKKVADVEEKVASEQPPLDIVEKSSKETEEKETDETTKEELPVGTKVEDSEKDTTTLKSEVEELEKSEEQPLDIKKKEVVETKDDVATEKSKDVEQAVSSTTKETTKPEVLETEKPKPAVADDDDLDDLDISPEEIRKHLESQPVYIFTSLAGGMQVILRSNNLAAILQGNGIKFEYRDLGTDEEAKKIWKRQANGKTLPGVVRGDDYIGNWQEIEDANEEYRLRELLYETL